MQIWTMTGMAEYKFAIAVSALDCTGCGSCANVCPGKKGAKALAMENMEANVACSEILRLCSNSAGERQMLSQNSKRLP